MIDSKNPLASDKDAPPNKRKEIVVVSFGSSGAGMIFSTDPVYIMQVAERGGTPMNYLTRDAVRFMAKRESNAELKQLLQQIAAGRALFIIEEDGTMHGPSSFTQST